MHRQRWHPGGKALRDMPYFGKILARLGSTSFNHEYVTQEKRLISSKNSVAPFFGNNGKILRGVHGHSFPTKLSHAQPQMLKEGFLD
jgi:hypothetical protein